MRICLVRPPAFVADRSFPLNIGILSGALKSAGHEVTFVDGEKIAYQLLDSKLNAKIAAKLFAKLYIKSTEALVEEFFSGDDSLWNVIIEQIQSTEPDLIGFSCYTAGISSTKRLAYLLREKYKINIPIVLGGIHPTATLQETLKYLPQADFVVAGEGDRVLSELAAVLENRESPEKINGLVFRKNGHFVVNPPGPPISLEGLPLTDFEIASGYGRYVLHTSRGCPFACAFCASKVMWGRKVRFRSPTDVAQEVAILNQKYGIKTIRFGDDTFTVNSKHMRAVKEAIKDNGIQDVKFRVGSRVDTIDQEKLAILQEMNVTNISFGIETGSHRIVDCIKKELKLDQVIPTIRMVNDAGIYTRTFFIINHPGETKEDMEATLGMIKQLVKECPLNIIDSNIGFPYPGTEWWEYCKERGLLNSINIYELSHKYNHQLQISVNMSDEPLQVVEKMRRKINRVEFYSNLWRGWHMFKANPKEMLRRYL